MPYLFILNIEKKQLSKLTKLVNANLYFGVVNSSKSFLVNIS